MMFSDSFAVDSNFRIGRNRRIRSSRIIGFMNSCTFGCYDYYDEEPLFWRLCCVRDPNAIRSFAYFAFIPFSSLTGASAACARKISRWKFIRYTRRSYKWPLARRTAAARRWWAPTAVWLAAVVPWPTAGPPARSASKARIGWRVSILWWTRTTRRCPGAGTPKTSSPISGYRRTTFVYTTKVLKYRIGDGYYF